MKTSKIHRLDDLLRERLRKLTKHRCEQCLKIVVGFSSQVSHGFTRKLMGLRWDRLNTLHLCASCHWRYTNDPPMAEQFLRAQLGDVGYDELVRRRRILIKTTWLDYEKIKDYIAQLQLGKYPLVSPTPLWEL